MHKPENIRAQKSNMKIQFQTINIHDNINQDLGFRSRIQVLLRAISELKLPLM